MSEQTDEVIEPQIPTPPDPWPDTPGRVADYIVEVVEALTADFDEPTRTFTFEEVEFRAHQLRTGDL